MSLLKVFINPANSSGQKVEEAYSQQVDILRKVWRDDTYGIERVFRLFLCLVQFIFPVLLIRDIFGRFGATSRKLAVELYNILKLAFPFIVLVTGNYHNPVIIGIIIYLLCETILHILNLIFLSDIHAAGASFRRSILLLSLHYLEVVLDFAVFYIGFNLLNQDLTWVSALYFSLVLNTTVGFGDITAKGQFAQMVVIVQLLVCLLFVVLFVNYFSQKASED